MNASTSYTIGTIPSGYRPNVEASCTGCAGVSGASFYFYANTSGTVTIYTGLTNIPADDTIALTLAWTTGGMVG